MKVKCPDCKHRFEVDSNEYDDGDFFVCPECNLEMTIVIEEGKLEVKTSREKELDEESEFGEEFDE